MKIEVVGASRLYSFLYETLPFFSFRMYVHILTSPYLELLASLPEYIKEMSIVFLDGEKKLNVRTARELRAAGYRSVWFVRRLHVKMIVIGSRPDYIVIGSSNLTSRSFGNYEVILIISRPNAELSDAVRRIMYHIETQKYAPPL